MSVEQSDTVDFMSMDDASGRVLLTISDHLDWDQHESAHLLMLQEKLNSYLRFIESGEINKKFPKAHGRPIVIRVIGKFPLSQQASLFYQKTKTAIQNAGFSLEFDLLH